MSEIPYTEIFAATAEKLLSEIETLYLGLRNPPAEKLIWRGTGRASYSLKPTSLRANQDKSLIEEIEIGARIPDKYRTHISRCYFEWKEAREFFLCANRQALDVGVRSMRLHHLLMMSASEGFSKLIIGRDINSLSWPIPDLWEALALAQHHGIKTRFLDWTTDPFTACYFAAASSLNEIEDSSGEENATVWMLATQLLNRTSLASPIPDFDEHSIPDLPDAGSRVHIVDVPFRGNENLAAQSGRFTVISGAPGSILDSDQCLGDYLARWRDWAMAQPKLRDQYQWGPDKQLFIKFVFPQSEAAALLTLLDRRGYHAGRLFPGYAGCVRAIYDRRRAAEQTKI